MQLTFKNAAGTAFSFDPQAGQWTAREEGEKPTSSQDLSALTTRLERRAKTKETPVVKKEPQTVGMAGIATVHNHSEWNLRVVSMDAKLDWDSGAGQPSVVRYKQNTPNANWESAREPIMTLTPEVCDAEDIACFKSLVRHQEILRLLAEGEKTLAQAWVAPTPVVSQLMAIEGRSERFNDKGMRTNEPEAITWSPTRPQESYNRNKVVVSPAWPLLTAAPTPRLTDQELAEWTDEGTQGWRHTASGVRLLITTMSDLSATFEVRRPTPEGEQAVSSGHAFLESFRLAQATVQVVQAGHAPVEEWRSTSAHWDQPTGNRRPLWPVRTFTEACVMLFPETRDSLHSEKEAYALRRTEVVADPTVPPSYNDRTKVAHAVWEKCSGDQTVAYRPVSPADEAVLDARDTLRAHAAQLIATTQDHRASMATRMKRLHAATVAKAYQDSCDGTTQTPTQAANRLTIFFERLTAQVHQEPALRALAAHVAQLGTADLTPGATATPVFEAPEIPAPAVPGVRRQAAPARRRPR